jgi:hypothetical protein
MFDEDDLHPLKLDGIDSCCVLARYAIQPSCGDHWEQYAEQPCVRRRLHHNIKLQAARLHQQGGQQRDTNILTFTATAAITTIVTETETETETAPLRLLYPRHPPECLPPIHAVAHSSESLPSWQHYHRLYVWRRP